MNPQDDSAAALIEGARRDLEYAERVLERGGDRLVAIVAVARAAKRADDATFALLDDPRKPVGQSVLVTPWGYSMIAVTNEGGECDD